MTSLKGRGYVSSEPLWAIGRGYDHDIIVAVEELIASVQSQEEVVTAVTNTESMMQRSQDVLIDTRTRRESVLTHRQRHPNKWLSNTFLPGPTQDSHHADCEFEHGFLGMADPHISHATIAGQRREEASQRLNDLRNQVADSMRDIEVVSDLGHSIPEGSSKASRQASLPEEDSIQHSEQLEDGELPSEHLVAPPRMSKTEATRSLCTSSRGIEDRQGKSAYAEAQMAARVINSRIDKERTYKQWHDKRERGSKKVQTREEIADALNTSNSDTRADHRALEVGTIGVPASERRNDASVDNQQSHSPSVRDVVTAGDYTIDTAHPINHPAENKEKSPVEPSTAKKRRPRKKERIATWLARQAIADQHGLPASYHIPRNAPEVKSRVEAMRHSWKYGDR